MTMITGMFKDQHSINEALGGLSHIGVEPEEVSVVVSQTVRGLQGGAVAATMLAVGSIVFPLFNVVAAGPIVAALAGASAGGITGGLIGALAGAGIPRQEAVMLEGGLSQGKILLAVHVEGGREALVREVLHAAGAHIALAA